MSHSAEVPQQERNEYKWGNKDQYPHGNIQQLGEDILKQRSQQGQELSISKMFNKVMKQSRVGLLHFDDSKKQMNLYTIPTETTKLNIMNTQISHMTLFDDIRHRFCYMTQTGYLFGQKGAFFKATALANRQKHWYSINFNARIKERLDNSFVCNKYVIGFCYYLKNLKYADNLSFSISRESRENYLSFYDDESEKKHKFGLKQPQTELSKQSNLLSLRYDLKKSNFTLTGILGMDFSNQSFFKALKLKYFKGFNISDELRMDIHGQMANMWGSNIRKEDFWQRHNNIWPGFRSKNHLTTGFTLYFLRFPYASYFEWIPLIYGQAWATFHPNQLKKYDTIFEADYGIGMTSKDNRFSLSFSLFNFSRERKAGLFGPIKFSF